VISWIDALSQELACVRVLEVHAVKYPLDLISFLSSLRAANRDPKLLGVLLIFCIEMVLSCFKNLFGHPVDKGVKVSQQVGFDELHPLGLTEESLVLWQDFARFDSSFHVFG